MDKKCDFAPVCSWDNFGKKNRDFSLFNLYTIKKETRGQIEQKQEKSDFQNPEKVE